MTTRTLVLFMVGSSGKGDLFSHWPMSNTPITASPATKRHLVVSTRKSLDGPRSHPPLLPPHGSLPPSRGPLLVAGTRALGLPIHTLLQWGPSRPSEPLQAPIRSLRAGSPWGQEDVRPPHFTRAQCPGMAITGPQRSDLLSPMCRTEVCKHTRRHQTTHGAGLHVSGLCGAPTCLWLERKDRHTCHKSSRFRRHRTLTGDGCAQWGRRRPRRGPPTQMLSAPPCDGILRIKAFRVHFFPKNTHKITNKIQSPAL